MKFYKILPSVITSLSLVCGVIAIVYDDIELGLWLLLAAQVLDWLDGWTARRLNATSEFGKELDSLVDMVSFGVAPIVLWVKYWSYDSITDILLLAVYVVCGALRLARFNVTKSSVVFQGMPIPGGALLIIGSLLAVMHNEYVHALFADVWIRHLFVIASGLLLVGPQLMLSFKMWGTSRLMNILIAGPIAVGLLFIFLAPEMIILAGVLIYVLLSLMFAAHLKRV